MTRDEYLQARQASLEAALHVNDLEFALRQMEAGLPKLRARLAFLQAENGKLIARNKRPGTCAKCGRPVAPPSQICAIHLTPQDTAAQAIQNCEAALAATRRNLNTAKREAAQARAAERRE